MATAGPSSSSGPTLKALQRALEEVSTSMAAFSTSHVEWCMHAQARLPIEGLAWQDYQTDLVNHIGSIRGMRTLRAAVQKELQWLEKHAAEVGGDTVFTSSNAFYLSTSWQHILYSALHQSPVMELDAFMPTSTVKKAKSIKVDIVCEGGKRWVRHSTIKPLSLLSEFRTAESYVVDDGDSSEEEGHSTAGQVEDERPKLTLELINSQLAEGKVDGIASQCSLMKLAREMQAAADIAQSRSQWGRPVVEMVLTRISLQDMSSSLEGKFYDEEEKFRYEARLKALVAELEKMGIAVVLKEKRQLFEDLEERRYSPSSISSGETHDADHISRLPSLCCPSAVKNTTPTTTLNMDLSALVALVSHISHVPISRLPSMEEADKYFIKQHWNGRLTSDQVEDEESSDAEKCQGTQHARALRDQLRREMTTDCFFEAIMRPLQEGQQLNLICTKEAERKFFEILTLVGGPTEQKRARLLFEGNGHDEFWRGSKWEDNKEARAKIVLPVKSIAFDAADVGPPSEEDDHFTRLAKKSVQDGLCELQNPTSHTTNTSSSSAGTRIQRQTPHTLASLLFGFVHGYTTLTTNIASIKWLSRDIGRCEVTEASTLGYEDSKGSPSPSSSSSFSSIVLFYPRSLAEKMMTSTYPISTTRDDEEIHEASIDWAGSTANEEYQPMAKGIEQEQGQSQPDSYLDVKGSGNSYGDKTPTVDSSMAAAALALPFLETSAISPSGSKLKRCYRSTKNWIRGPRPRSTLLIRHFRWWPLRPVEDAWLRWTSRIAWKNPNRHLRIDGSSDEEGQRDDDESHSLPPLPQHDDAWWEGIKKDWKLNSLHWIALALTFIGWAFAFAFLVKDLWYEASVVGADGSQLSPTFFTCTTTYWLGNAQCGLDGQSCAPFSYPTSVPFRCPASCETTTLGGARAVGDQLPSFVTLVVGGGPSANSTSVESSEEADTGPYMYRGDSFVCSAAIHAGIISSGKGGCGNLWLNGAYSGYQGIERNGIKSTSFNSSFPISYYFDTDGGVHGEKCTDRRYRGYILDVILLAWVGFVLQPKNIVYYFTLIVVGFWHVNFISEPREFPISVGDPMGDFLPTLFIAYAYWRLVFRYLWPAFESLPLERNVWIQGFYWLGVLLDVVFVNVPLSRLVISDITTQPGALTSLIVIIVVVVILAINQVRVIRKVGKLPKYLTLSIIGGIIIGLLAAIPTTGLRLHHYIIAMVLLLYCSFATRLSLIYSAFLLGMFLNGAGRWGFDGLIQDVATIVGTGLSGSSLPAFLAASNWTGVPNQGGPASSTGLVHWQGITPDVSSSWDSFQLLVDDVLRLQSSETSFNMSSLSQYYLSSMASTDLASSLLPSSNLSYYPVGNGSSEVNALIAEQPHYLRLAYYNSNSGNSGDFTKAATLYFNGTFISPASGST